MRISFTNHSKETQSVYIVRRPNGSLTDVELFSKVKIAPEQTVTRAFYLEKDEGVNEETLNESKKEMAKMQESERCP